jgi:hypothetical protein
VNTDVEVDVKPDCSIPGQETTSYALTMTEVLAVTDEFVSNQKVCIIDSGLDTNHPDLEETTFTGWEPSDSAEDWDTDTDGHGTRVAGVIVAKGNNNKGIQGVIRNGKLKVHVAKIFDSTKKTIKYSRVVEAIGKCKDSGANIINMSLQWVNTTTTKDLPGHDAVSNAIAALALDDEILVVAAAGNSAQTQYPGKLPGTFSVGAVNETAQYQGTNTNAQVDISAPGFRICMTNAGGLPDYRLGSGTSFAAPIVSGIAALIWSHCPVTCKPSDIKRILMNSSMNCRDDANNEVDCRYVEDGLGQGIVNAKSALDYANESGFLQPSAAPSEVPSLTPSLSPSDNPSQEPSDLPSLTPSMTPSVQPSQEPSEKPSELPSLTPSLSPSDQPSQEPSDLPSLTPSVTPSNHPSQEPSEKPSDLPSLTPSLSPSDQPSQKPSDLPSLTPSVTPSVQLSQEPSDKPSELPSLTPSLSPSDQPSQKPSDLPSLTPSVTPSVQPSQEPSREPSDLPSVMPSVSPSAMPSQEPSQEPSDKPSDLPSVSLSPSDQPTRQPSNEPSLLLSVSFSPSLPGFGNVEFSLNGTFYISNVNCSEVLTNGVVNGEVIAVLQQSLAETIALDAIIVKRVCGIDVDVDDIDGNRRLQVQDLLDGISVTFEATITTPCTGALCQNADDIASNLINVTSSLLSSQEFQESIETFASESNVDVLSNVSLSSAALSVTSAVVNEASASPSQSPSELNKNPKSSKTKAKSPTKSGKQKNTKKSKFSKAPKRTKLPNNAKRQKKVANTNTKSPSDASLTNAPKAPKTTKAPKNTKVAEWDLAEVSNATLANINGTSI